MFQNASFLLRSLERLRRGLARGNVGANNQVSVVDAPGSGVGTLVIIEDVKGVPDFHRPVSNSVGVGDKVGDVAVSVDALNLVHRTSRHIDRGVVLAVV